ncbi:MAG: hypothetical protein ACKV2Q_24820 [Planctomycetaceae bacterium]
MAKKPEASAKVADHQPNNELSIVETIALAKCLKENAVTKARGELPENSAESFDFRVRIQGSVQRGTGTPESTSEVPASLSLSRLDVFCHALQQLGIGPKKLRSTLEAVAKLEAAGPLDGHQKLAEVFSAVATEVAATLPPRTVTAAARSGNITVQASVWKLD